MIVADLNRVSRLCEKEVNKQHHKTIRHPSWLPPQRGREKPTRVGEKPSVSYSLREKMYEKKRHRLCSNMNRQTPSTSFSHPSRLIH